MENIPEHMLIRMPHVTGFVRTELVAVAGALLCAFVVRYAAKTLGPPPVTTSRSDGWLTVAGFVVGALIGSLSSFPMVYASVLGYLFGASIGLFALHCVATDRDPVQLVHALTVYALALLFGVCGGVYNEVMYGIPIGFAVLRIPFSLGLCSIASFLFIVYLHTCSAAALSSTGQQGLPVVQLEDEESM